MFGLVERMINLYIIEVKGKESIRFTIWELRFKGLKNKKAGYKIEEIGSPPGWHCSYGNQALYLAELKYEII
jgi:hypothetical protein